MPPDRAEIGSIKLNQIIAVEKGVKAEATEKHPAQVDVYYEDVEVTDQKAGDAVLGYLFA